MPECTNWNLRNGLVRILSDSTSAGPYTTSSSTLRKVPCNTTVVPRDSRSHDVEPEIETVEQGDQRSEDRFVSLDLDSTGFDCLLDSRVTEDDSLSAARVSVTVTLALGS